MRKGTIYLIVIALLLTLVGCSGNSGFRTGGKRGLQDSLYTEEAAMSIHQSKPERAMVMIDSAVIVGNITWLRGEYLKAITQYGGLSNLHLSRQTCLNLLDDVFKQPGKYLQSYADSLTIEQIYLLLTSLEFTSGKYSDVVRYATEASRLAHALDMPEEVAKMEGYIAYVMTETGKTDEGIERLRATIDALRNTDNFQRLIAYESTSKKLLHILLNNKRYAEMVPICEDMLQVIGHLDSHPEHFSGLSDGFDPAEYVDYARGQALAFLATAYARQATAIANEQEMGKGDLRSTTALRNQLIQKAREAETEMRRTKWSQSLDCETMMTAAYHHMGEFERFDKAMDRLDSMRTDTININYFIRLNLRATAAQMRGRLDKAIGYMDRAFIIRDSIDRRNQQEQLNELATLYHLQEEQLARQQAEADAHLMKTYVLFIAAALLAAIAFASYFFYKRRETARKNRVLAREITEAIEYKDKYEALKQLMTATTADGNEEADTSLPSDNISLANLSDQDLFLHLYQVIMRDKLFLDPQLDRQALVDRFSLPKERIGAAFAKGSSYKSLIDFLTDCRLLYAAKVLTERPDLPIVDVAHSSGFPSANTFGRNFKQKYAITPTQFREQQEQG